MPQKPIMLLAGAAEGFGEALVKTFCAAGYDVVGLSRSSRAVSCLEQAANHSGGSYVHVLCDLTIPSEVARGIAPIADHVSVVIYNAHRVMLKSFLETDAEEFESFWKTNCFGVMSVAQAILPKMQERKQGAILLSGATASIRGGARTAAFASAKFALRGLAQALAREFGPQGVHVAHVILDGLIDEPQTTTRFGESSAQRMDAMSLAREYLHLVNQPKDAWTHELDLRPYEEKF